MARDEKLSDKRQQGSGKLHDNSAAVAICCGKFWRLENPGPLIVAVILQNMTGIPLKTELI